MLGPSDLADLMMLDMLVLEKDASGICDKSQGSNHNTDLRGFSARKAMPPSMDNYTSFYLFYQFRTFTSKRIYMIRY